MPLGPGAKAEPEPTEDAAPVEGDRPSFTVLDETPHLSEDERVLEDEA